ncbi:hypothetical protein RUM43_005270 [Polyplax serrata]|uniref:Uncharacterized protein n=1 Tax=Polyplax serrata TaxID=468196 RepID=A0AAN8NWF4_POLSC
MLSRGNGKHIAAKNVDATVGRDWKEDSVKGSQKRLKQKKLKKSQGWRERESRRQQQQRKKSKDGIGRKRFRRPMKQTLEKETCKT